MRVELVVEGMSCQHCVRAVTEALQKVEGVERVEVSLEAGRAVVEGEAPVERLVAAVEAEGYQARPSDG